MLSPDIGPGSKLPELRKTITQESINLYAQASGDFNPIHIDAEFARKTPLGGTIAHGMLVLAFVSESMTMVFGKDWLESGKLAVRFRSPARPGETVIVTSSIASMSPGQNGTNIKCDILCSNEKGEVFISGDAQVEVKK